MPALRPKRKFRFSRPPPSTQAFHKKAGLRIKDMVKSNWVYRKTSAGTAAARKSSGMAATAPAGSASVASRPTTARGADGPSTPSAARPSPG